MPPGPRFPILSGPAAEPGAPPGRKGKRAPWRWVLLLVGRPFQRSGYGLKARVILRLENILDRAVACALPGLHEWQARSPRATRSGATRLEGRGCHRPVFAVEPCGLAGPATRLDDPAPTGAWRYPSRLFARFDPMAGQPAPMCALPAGWRVDCPRLAAIDGRAGGNAGFKRVGFGRLPGHAREPNAQAGRALPLPGPRGHRARMVLRRPARKAGKALAGVLAKTAVLGRPAPPVPAVRAACAPRAVVPFPVGSTRALRRRVQHGCPGLQGCKPAGALLCAKRAGAGRLRAAAGAFTQWPGDRAEHRARGRLHRSWQGRPCRCPPRHHGSAVGLASPA